MTTYTVSSGQTSSGIAINSGDKLGAGFTAVSPLLRR